MKPRAKPLMLDLREDRRLVIYCRRCKVGGEFEGTAAFRIECVCGGQVRATPMPKRNKSTETR